MMVNRRNLVFRVSIVINIAVLLYAAMHLSGPTQPGTEWITVSGDGSERSASEYHFYNQEARNDSEPRPLDSSVRNYDESTSQKTPSTTIAANKTTSSTASMVEFEKRLTNIDPSEPDVTVPPGSRSYRNLAASEKKAGTIPVVDKNKNNNYNNETTDNLDIVDENALSEATLARLHSLLSCYERPFKRQTIQRGEYWVLMNYVRADHVVASMPCHDSITYTTHAGFEFLDNVQPLVERWMAPVSLAIHAPGSDIKPTVDSIRYLRDCLDNDLIKQFVTFHIFFSQKHTPSQIPNPDKFLNVPYNCSNPAPYISYNTSATYMKQKRLLYPVNVARNIARDAALTHFILPSDIELYPSPNLVPRFLNMIARNAKPLSTSKQPRVFPISIFEVDAKVQVPSTKTELQKMLAKRTAVPFHIYVCPQCHNIPKSQQWIAAKETNQMDVFHVGKRRGKFVHWEPIFIGTHQDPYYDERLSWEGKRDKMTQGYVLCVKDYDFMILNNAFLIHKPGIKRIFRDPTRDAIAGKQSRLVDKVIMPELKKIYGTRNGCSL